MRGMSSELIVMISVVLIAMVAVFALRGWLSTQLGRMGNIDMAEATFTSTSVNPSSMVIVINVKNLLPNQISIIGFQILLSNGTVLTGNSAGISTSPALPTAVAGKSDGLLTVFLNNMQNSILKISVNVQDNSTGQTQWISAVGS